MTTPTLELRILSPDEVDLTATVDVLIALGAADAGCRMLSRDRDFERIRSVVPFELTRF